MSEGTYEYTFKDQNEKDTMKIVPSYTYKVSIALSNSSRRVHFIGNGPASIPFGRDNEVLPTLLGSEGKTGFWQMITLRNVTARQDNAGNYVYHGQVRNPEDPYEPSDSLQAAFSHIPLIRNWAKIELNAADSSHFTPYSFAVVNVPRQGTLVPYGGEKGFITNYKDLSFDQLRSAEYNYGGNLPTSVEFDHTIPSKQDFLDYTNGVKEYKANAGHDDEDHTVYLYERPVPDANIEPSYVIVYGRYYNPDDTSTLTDPDERKNGVYCFYKVDLMAGSEYYPVLRNFKYEIQIDKISARGHDTPEAAAAAAGSADVSADVNASTLPDISDGTRRMAVQPWMSKTFIEAEDKTEQLYVTFYNDINGDNPAPDLTLVSEGHFTFELIPASAGIILDVEIGEAVTDPDRNDYGWRPVSFAIASPEQATARSQTLRIKCKTRPDDVEESPLYRDVVISLLPTQTMRVSCENPRVLQENGAPQRVDVAIPDGLVESMFPLNFLIEAEKLTLTPDPGEENLPVISETSIIGNYPSFHFQRTLTWEEYSALPARLDYEDETRWRTFSSHFVTNCEISGTRIFVANRFFHTGHTEFVNYASFKNPRYTTSIPREAGRTVSVAAQLMSTSQSLDPVYLDLQGLEPAEGSGILTDPDTGEYYYVPSGQDMTFALQTTVSDGDVCVTLSSKTLPYEPAVLTPWHFRDMKIADMATPNGDHTGDKYANVVYGRVNRDANKQVMVSYFTDPGNPAPRVSVSGLSGLKASNNASWDDGGNISPTAQDRYREKWFETLQGSQPVSVTFGANGYVEETLSASRFSGSIFTWNVSSQNDWQSLVTNGGSLQKNHWALDNTLKAGFTMSVTTPEGKPAEKHDASNGIVLPAGGHYELEVTIDSVNSDIYLFYGQVFYYVSDGTVRKPQSVEPEPEGSIYYGYLGNNYEYMWNLPFGETGGKLVMDAPAGADIVITRVILKGFHGYFNDGGGDVNFDNNLNNGGSL